MSIDYLELISCVGFGLMKIHPNCKEVIGSHEIIQRNLRNECACCGKELKNENIWAFYPFECVREIFEHRIRVVVCSNDCLLKLFSE